MTMTMDELMKVLDMQEDILQFTHFTNADAWELGWRQDGAEHRLAS